jgi:hypothetical protein
VRAYKAAADKLSRIEAAWDAVGYLWARASKHGHMVDREREAAKQQSAGGVTQPRRAAAQVTGQHAAGERLLAQFAAPCGRCLAPPPAPWRQQATVSPDPEPAPKQPCMEVSAACEAPRG